MLDDIIQHFRAIKGHSGGKHIDPTLQDNALVSERLRRAHLPRWELPRYVLNHSIWIDSWWQRRQEKETCGVLHGSEPDVQSNIIEKGIAT